MDNDTLWQRLLSNICQWWPEKTELLKTFKELHDSGAILEWKTVKSKHAKQPVPTIRLKRGKIPEEDWQLIRTLKLEPHTKEIQEIFDVTAFGTIIDVQLAKPLPENCLYHVLCKYFDEIVAAKEKSEEFTVQVGDREVTIVPIRTNKSRTELTIEELYTLKYLQEIGKIQEGGAIEWVRWNEEKV